MAQLQYLNKIHIYGNKSLLKGNIKYVKSVINKIITDHHLILESIEVNIISDDDLLQINQRSLNHDYYTDIITFDYSDKSQILGDIYISIDRVKENASNYKTTFFNELLRVMCHGVLHLSGYKDKSKMEKAKMTKMENLYIDEFRKSSTWNTIKNKKKRVPRGT